MFRRKSGKTASKRSSYGETSSRADSSTTQTQGSSNGDGMEGSKWSHTSDLQARLAGERRRRMTSPPNNGEDLFLTLANDAASTSTEGHPVPKTGQRRRSRTTLSNAPPTSITSPPPVPSNTTLPKLTTDIAPSKVNPPPLSAPADGTGSSKHRRHSTQTSTPNYHRTSQQNYASSGPRELPKQQQQQQQQDQQSSNDSNATYRARAANATSGRRTQSVNEKEMAFSASRPAKSTLPTPPTTAHSYEQSTPSEPALVSPQPKKLAAPRQSFPQPSEDADSVASATAATATAASTVWDELDELKSRIRHLESSGGGGAMTKSRNGDSSFATDSSERPYSATTNTTTSTSSNPHRTQMYQNGALLPNTASNLLRSALGKSKILVDNQVYQALELSVSDALSVAAMANSLGTRPESTAHGAVAAAAAAAAATMTEKRVKRQADNLCRSLTELCISLCEYRQRMDKFDPVAARGKAFSLHHQLEEQSPSHYLEERRARLDRTERLSARTTASRQIGMSLVRPDSRRSSLLSRDNDNDSIGPRSAVNRYPVRDDISEYGHSEPDATLRLQTRIMTEGHHRSSPLPQYHQAGISRNEHSASRAYRHSHLSPETQAAVEQTLAANRSNMSLNSTRSNLTYASALPHQEGSSPGGGGGGEALYVRSSSRYPPSVAASSHSRFLEEKRQQRVASAGQLTGLLGMGYGGGGGGGGRPDSRNGYGYGNGGYGSSGSRMMPGTFINEY